LKIIRGKAGKAGKADAPSIEQEPNTPDEWVAKLGADARMAKKMVMKLTSQAPKHHEVFTQSLKDDADRLRESGDKIEDALIECDQKESGENDEKLSELIKEAAEIVKETHNDIVAASRLLGEFKPAEVTPAAKKRRNSKSPTEQGQ